MIFDIWKDIVSQSSYFKSRPDPVTLGGAGGETYNLGKRFKWNDQDETWWEEYVQVQDTRLT